MTAVYLCARMTGVENHNVTLFETWTKRFRDDGLTVFSPPEISMPGFFVGPTFMRSRCLAAEFDIICTKADAVLVLQSDWRESTGCVAEVSAAIAVGLPVYVKSNIDGDDMGPWYPILDQWFSLGIATFGTRERCSFLHDLGEWR